MESAPTWHKTKHVLAGAHTPSLGAGGVLNHTTHTTSKLTPNPPRQNVSSGTQTSQPNPTPVPAEQHQTRSLVQNHLVNSPVAVRNRSHSVRMTVPRKQPLMTPLQLTQAPRRQQRELKYIRPVRCNTRLLRLPLVSSVSPPSWPGVSYSGHQSLFSEV